MSIKQRLEKLEAAKIVQDVKVDIIHIIIEPDGTISGATQRNADGKYVSVSDEELAEICADNQIVEAAK
ncbi:hypothetical protein Nit79A3_2746 [Nitrosomonas sp. Is79A3]|uniref:hypothetical protein n=1 Tax=Nitrosomonas sp. (strain Is79A3) TaxID=261292 RepID=UPI000215D20C